MYFFSRIKGRSRRTVAAVRISVYKRRRRSAGSARFDRGVGSSAGAECRARHEDEDEKARRYIRAAVAGDCVETAQRGRERRRSKRRLGGERGGRPRFSYTLLSALTNLNSGSPDNGLALVKRASALMARIRLKWERRASKASRRPRGRRRRRWGHGRSKFNDR